jgi:hypothetical protein
MCYIVAPEALPASSMAGRISRIGRKGRQDQQEQQL